MTTLVPADFKIPLCVETADFIIRPLMISDAVKDYDAVMTSLDHLQGIFGPESDWPTRELSLEQDIIDLGWHQKEFQRRSSFAYTVMSPDQSTCLGCLYIYPHEAADYDAKVYCWVRASHASLLDQILFARLQDWLKRDWPFINIEFPGRTPS
ncbi:MAG: GNAT family N-acetyltransferase [Acidocella sp. 20-57-95]|nr:MAG: GNAT family N-acetyltransferase [Acidocella sp. 20-57-95]OYV58418.1 MAG: GNAT family N-acetyltransferase [Acidocella sp. 21-58-7]